MANDVKLTFAGDTSNLEKSFDRVGSSADGLDRKVHDSSKAVDEHGSRLEALGEKADGSETSLIGIHDVIDGTATVMKGPGKQGMASYIQGWADIAGGIAPLLISMASMNVAMVKNAITGAATAIWTGVLKVGTLAWAAAQWVLNAALTANPIGLIIVGIILLIGIIVLIATKTTWFQTIWRAVWGFIKGAAQAVGAWFAGPFKDFFVGAFNRIRSAVSAVGSFFKSVWSGVTSFVSGIPGRIFGFFSGLPGRFRSIGSAIINGIIGGIKSMVGHLANVAANAAKSALNAAKRFLHIASPSRVFRDQVGKNMVLGMAQGITANMGAVHSALQTTPTSLDTGPTQSSMATINAGQRGSQRAGGPTAVTVQVTGNSDADRAMGAWMQRLARDGRFKGMGAYI